MFIAIEYLSLRCLKYCERDTPKRTKNENGVPKILSNDVLLPDTEWVKREWFKHKRVIANNNYYHILYAPTGQATSVPRIAFSFIFCSSNKLCLRIFRFCLCFYFVYKLYEKYAVFSASFRLFYSLCLAVSLSLILVGRLNNLLSFHIIYWEIYFEFFLVQRRVCMTRLL